MDAEALAPASAHVVEKVFGAACALPGVSPAGVFEPFASTHLNDCPPMAVVKRAIESPFEDLIDVKEAQVAAGVVFKRRDHLARSSS